MATFPNHNIPQSEKLTDSWMLRMARAIWDEFNDTTKDSFHRGADRYALNRLYALGKQPPERYMPMFEIAEDKDSSFINLDFSPPAIIPKFMRIMNNKFGKLQFTLDAQAIDPFALEDKLKYETEERANIKLRGILQEVGLPEDVLNSGELDQPKDEEELLIKMEFGYKHNMAIDIEKRIDAIFKEERIHDKLTSVRRYNFEDGVAGFKSFTDPENGKVGFRVVDPSNLVVSATKDPFFTDMWYCGEMILMTIDEIRRESDGKIDEEYLEDLARRNSGMNGNPEYFPTTTQGFTYDSFQVPVLDFEVKSLDKETYEKRKDKRGNPVLGKKYDDKRKDDREYFEDETYNIYRCKWIYDTDKVFNYGLKNDVVRKASSLWDCRLSYILVAPELSNMSTQPIIENIIPIVDQVTLAWFKLQNVIARARPKGIAIEIGALEDVSLGDGYENMKPIDLLDMLNQTGNLVFRRMSLDGTPSNYKPIEQLENGLGQEASEYFAVIERYMGMIREIIGFNDLTDGSTPDPKTLNKVAQFAVDASNNSIHHLLHAERYLIERLADDIAVRVHDSITLREDSIYKNILGPQTIKSLREDDNHLFREYGIYIEYNGDDSERKQFEAVDLNNAVAAGQITIADKIAIKNVSNLKQAELLLAHRVKKNQEIKMKEQKELVITNAQASADAAAKAEQAKQQTIMAETQAKMEQDKQKYMMEMELLKLKYDLELRNLQATDQTKKEVEVIRGENSKQTASIKAERVA